MRNIVKLKDKRELWKASLINERNIATLKGDDDLVFDLDMELDELEDMNDYQLKTVN